MRICLGARPFSFFLPLSTQLFSLRTLAEPAPHGVIVLPEICHYFLAYGNHPMDRPAPFPIGLNKCVNVRARFLLPHECPPPCRAPPPRPTEICSDRFGASFFQLFFLSPHFSASQNSDIFCVSLFPRSSPGTFSFSC